MPIQQYGDGQTARDYTYIDDIVNGIIAASKYDAKSFDIFNLGGSATTKLSELIALLEQTLGMRAQIEQLPNQPGDVPKTYADISKATTLLNYTPKTSIQQGIEKFAEWFQASRQMGTC